jgi:transcriptional regulator with XRE-family HTH domain
MQLNEILAVRLTDLMRNRPDLDTQTKLHKATGLSQSTFQRMLSKQVHIGLDVLEITAEAFGVPPESLIAQLEDDGRELQITPSYDELELLRAWRKLPADDKHIVMAFIKMTNKVKSKKPPPNK